MLGMMAKMPVPGVVWQTLHYLLGLRSLGFEPYYVEAHARTPSMLMQRPTTTAPRVRPRSSRAVLRRFGLGDRWAYHALHDDGRVLRASSERQLRRALPRGRADHQPARRHRAAAGARATRPPRLPRDRSRRSCRSSCTTGARRRVDFLEPHCAFFTFAENLGTPACALPVVRALPASARRASRSCSTAGRASGSRPRRASRRSATGASRGATSAIDGRDLRLEQGRRVDASSSTCPGAPGRRSSWR